jgi:spermidine/putrescine-binding protein
MPAHGSLAEAGRRVGREVEFEEVSSNEDLEELMAAGEPYDLVFPSDYLIERLLAADALLELEVPAEQLRRLAGWAREEIYDPGCRWSMPFAFGTTGYLCNPALVDDDCTWATLFSPSGRNARRGP